MTYTRQSKILQSEKDSFSDKAQGLAVIKQKISFLLTFLQAELQIIIMNTIYFYLYSTIIENLSEEGEEN